MKAKAVIEVVLIFVITLGLVALVGRSPLSSWERGITNRFYLEYAVFIAVPLIVLLVTRRNLREHGLNFRPVSYHLSVAAIALIPVILSYLPMSFFNHKEWAGSLIMSAIEIAVLFAVAWMLRRKPARNESGVIVGGIALAGVFGLSQQATAGNAISAFIFYLLFLGFGEELLFRGYIQSRLNTAFGRPFKFFGVNWGWGVIFTAVLFGLMHVLNTGSLLRGAWQLAPWWGLWTFFGGLVSGFVREKTGSILAPTILHGLPQAMASAFLGI